MFLFSFIRDLAKQHRLLKFLLDPHDRSSLHFHLNWLCAALSKHSLMYLLFCCIYGAFVCSLETRIPDSKIPNATIALILEGEFVYYEGEINLSTVILDESKCIRVHVIKSFRTSRVIAPLIIILGFTLLLLYP